MINTVLRVDLNSPVIDGKIVVGKRFKEHIKTINSFLKPGRRLVMLAHQGRKGDNDFLDLTQHYKYLSEFVKGLSFVKGFKKDDVIKAINGLSSDEILLLDNVRFLNLENGEAKPELWLKNFLEDWCDDFVLDSLSVAHRDVWSVTGFSNAVAGPVLLDEYNNVQKMLDPVKTFSLVLGGAKVSEPLMLLNSSTLSKCFTQDKVFIGGLLGEAILLTKGVHLGRKEEMLKRILDLKGFKEFIKADHNVFLPVDFMLEDGSSIPVNGVKNNDLVIGVGVKTVKLWLENLKGSNTVLFKGPVEWLEKSDGKLNLKLIHGVKGFKFVAGGHLGGLVGSVDNGYVSLSGGAVLKLLTGEVLPGLVGMKRLKTSKSICRC